MLLSDIEKLDRDDNLAQKRAAFQLPADVIYLNGNSLGPLPAAVPRRIQALIEQEWGADLITSWNKHGWIDMPERVGNKLAPLLGAGPDQVVCCDSVSINLFKLLTAALKIRSARTVVLSQADNFPTDLYMAQGLEDLLDSRRMRLRTVPEQDLLSALYQDVAVLYLTQVNFRSGAKHDIASLTRAAHDNGALVIWDLSHSVGAVPLELDLWQVDFAVGCGYKFLSGGPGAPAFVYASERHHGSYQQTLQGWMGHQAPFSFSPDYKPAKGVAQFLTGTPNILSLAALDAALDVFSDVDAVNLYEKVRKLGELFQELLQSAPELESLQLESPKDSSARGAQLAYSHPQAWAISRALHAEGVMVDYREPDLLRFGFSPLVLSFEEIWRAIEKLRQVVGQQTFDHPEFQKRQKVT